MVSELCFDPTVLRFEYVAGAELPYVVKYRYHHNEKDVALAHRCRDFGEILFRISKDFKGGESLSIPPDFEFSEDFPSDIRPIIEAGVVLLVERDKFRRVIEHAKNYLEKFYPKIKPHSLECG